LGANGLDLLIVVHEPLICLSSALLAYALGVGPTLGIGQGCDGLGPMPVGGPKKNYGGGAYRNIHFMGVYIANVH